MCVVQVHLSTRNEENTENPFSCCHAALVRVYAHVYSSSHTHTYGIRISSWKYEGS